MKLLSTPAARLTASAEPRALQNTIITTFGRIAATITETTKAVKPGIGRQSQVWIRTSHGWRIAAAHVSDQPSQNRQGERLLQSSWALNRNVQKTFQSLTDWEFQKLFQFSAAHKMPTIHTSLGSIRRKQVGQRVGIS